MNSHRTLQLIAGLLLAVLAPAILVHFFQSRAAFPGGRGETGDDPDEAILKAAGVPSDGPGLAALFRGMTVPEVPDLAQLVRRLGSPEFAERDEATRVITAAGRAALPAHKEARHDPDAEIARRAGECFRVIEQTPAPIGANMLSPAVRVLVRRHPEGAVAALLGFLPAAPAGEVEEEIWYGLDSVAAMAPANLTVLAAALTDRAPARRAAAACRLGRLGGPAEKARVRRLLSDADSVVRLRVAQGLLAGRDAAGLPALTALLTDAPVEVAWQAEELLHWAAAEEAPLPTIGSGTDEQRRACRTAWECWRNDRGAVIDLVRRRKEPGRPGLVLVCSGGWVGLCGHNGRLRWALKTGPFPQDISLLPGSRVLLAEGGENGAFRGRDLAGKVLRDVAVEPALTGNPMTCEPLPDGGLFLATSKKVAEIGADGSARFRFRHGDSCWTGPERRSDGQVVRVRNTGPGIVEVEEMKPSMGQSRRLFLPDPASLFELARITPQALLSGHGLNEVIETDATGKTVWRARAPDVMEAFRLRDGNVLVGGPRLLPELDRSGRTVGEGYPPGGVRRMRPCLGLVRLGFAPVQGVDFDTNPAYRARTLKSVAPEARREERDGSPPSDAARRTLRRR